MTRKRSERELRAIAYQLVDEIATNPLAWFLKNLSLRCAVCTLRLIARRRMSAKLLATAGTP